MRTELAQLTRCRLGLTITAASAQAALATVLGAVDLPDFPEALGAWTYLVVPVLAFLATGAFVGLAVPGETALMDGGVTTERGEIELGALILLVGLGAAAGELASFALGRRLGRPFPGAFASAATFTLVAAPALAAHSRRARPGGAS